MSENTILEGIELRNQIVKDFSDNFKEVMTKDELETAIDTIKNASKKYHATGGLVTAIFYIHIGIDFNDDKYPDLKNRFRGDGGGIGAVGGGALIGDVYTDDLEKLISETAHFNSTFTPVYSNIVFLDKKNRVLGHYEAGSVSVTIGNMGGNGSWSK